MLIIALSTLTVSIGRAQLSGVPAPVQADLLVKLALYERGLVPRAQGRVVVMLVTKRGVPDSVRAATQLAAALQDHKAIAGLPHEEEIYEYTDAPSLVKACRARHCSMIYFGPGFSADVERLRAAFDGEDVLTVTTIPNDVRNGIVLGIDLLGGKPKLFLNFQQAKRQHVDFHSDVLRMMVLFQ
jgi:hypothetical protein